MKTSFFYFRGIKLLIKGLFLILIIIISRSDIIEVSAKATTDAFTTSSKDNNDHTEIIHIPMSISAKEAAISMNSIQFLEQLVKIKDTFDEKYYGLSENINQGCIIAGDSDSCLRMNENETTKTNNVNDFISVVEYTGRLWFMNKRGVQFQESVRIKKLSNCGSYSTIECMTRYKRKDRWVDCSRVLCSFQPNTKGRGLKMKIGSEILIGLPLFGIGSTVKKQILKTFQIATDSFFHQLAATEHCHTNHVK